MTSFKKILENANISVQNKINLEFASNYFKAKGNKKLASRSYLFFGESGIGKTYFANKLIAAINKEVINVTSMNGVTKKIMNDKEQVIFMDDLGYILNKNDFGSIDSDDKREFMKLLNIVKTNPKKLLIMTINESDALDEQMIDRIEVKIFFEIPSYESKKEFLKNEFSEYLSNKKIHLISMASIGYNFRDLPELVKFAYRKDNKMSLNAIRFSLKYYRPSHLLNLDIINSDVSLKNLIGNEEAVQKIKRIGLLYKNDSLSNKLNMKRTNLLLFHGPPGTGKTFSALALAGYIGYPLINIKANDLFGHGSVYGNIDKLFYMARRFKHCVILIDEADKIVGKEQFTDDNQLIGEFQKQLEGASKERIESIFVLTANHANRFGEAFRSRFTEVEFGLPTYEDRLKFCEETSKKIKKSIKIEVNIQDIANATKGKSYRDIQTFWNNMIFHYLETKLPINNDVLQSMIRPAKNEITNSIFG